MKTIRIGSVALLLTAWPLAQESREATATSRSEAKEETWSALEKRIAATGSGAASAERWKPEVEAFARRAAGSDDALSARLWLLQQTWWEREAGTMTASAKALAEGLIAEFPRSPQLARIAELAYVFSVPDREALLGKLADSGVREAEAAALHALGTRDLRSKDPETKARAVARLEKVLAKYADLPFKHTSYAAIADAALNAHPPAALKIGQTLPEIVGRDAEGKEMKLSEHRGKVVVLDFWGFW